MHMTIVLVIVAPIVCDMTCWSEYGEDEYIIMTNHGGADFRNAVRICEGENSSLVSIHSAKEHEYVDKLRNEFVGVPVWIGMRSYGAGLVYTWSGQTPVDYLPKVEHFHQPAEGTCLYLYYNWYEGDCDNSLHFVCKRPALNSSESCPKLTTQQSTVTQQYSPTDDVTMTSSTTSNQVTSQVGFTSEETTIPSTIQQQEETSTILTERSTNSKTNHVTTIFKTSASKTTKSDKISSELKKEEIQHKVEEIVKTLKIYKIPKRPPREAVGSEAIGAVALFILIGILGIVFLLDLVTIQNHLKLFLRNVRRRPRSRKRKKEAEENNVTFADNARI